ncbi:hypothetical protein GCM10020367_59950 [Streptomyces sannanensis]|uniref:Integral membrane protein n=1 Tax=Streptomyces sannanensis TaxID=285536 RepID=A0ABP6SKP2_9ACTN
MRAAAGIWRWRHNPLRRTTDLVEAWVALVALLLIVLASPAVGWLCASLMDDTLRRSARTEREQRHLATATVVRPVRERAPSGTEVNWGLAPPRRVVAGWTADDGSPRTGTVPTARRTLRAGDTFLIWTDRRGHAVSPPMSDAVARTNALFTGAAAAVAAAFSTECGRRLVVWRIVRRRYARLDQAWVKAGPDWGRAGTGS